MQRWRKFSPPVHPRGCGEHGRWMLALDIAGGSSPRVRGTPPSEQGQWVSVRFIPAGAGNTRDAWGTPVPHAVHPRGCGEHLCPSFHGIARYGSSPRVRGTPDSLTAEVQVSRFIPAGAGNTHCRWRRPRSFPVHPRGCGEHLTGWRLNTFSVGSSPRVRGTHRGLGRASDRSRFIPAGAGNTPRARGRLSTSPVHPRGCGEHSSIICCSVTTPGSSPRVRGTPVCCAENRIDWRFIPAGAGNTRRDRCAIAHWPVHPRGCGEHGRRRWTDRIGRRFIPAGAGNTSPA